MGRACGTNGRDRVFVRKPEGKRHLKDLGKDGRIILKLILKDLDRIHVI
jgi:hypothetical protein